MIVRDATAISRGAIKAGPSALSTARYAILLVVVLVLLSPNTAMAQACGAGWLATGVGVQGANHTVYAAAVLPGGDLIAGGDFTTVGGAIANYLARYNPTTNTWSAMGVGPNNEVFALGVLPSGDVVAVGFFNRAGATFATGCARYNPNTSVWSALGPGAGGSLSSSDVRTLTVLPDGDVLVGGAFAVTNIGANRIARYNPTSNTWTALGSGVTGPSGANTPMVWAIAVLPGGDFIVGGSFSSAGGIPTNNIARYSPSTNTWSALGPGTTSPVFAITVIPSGDVLVGGGWFSMAGVVPPSHVARYSPATNSWSGLGSGVDNYARAMVALPGGDVIVGGDFSVAGGVAVGSVARYSPMTNTWSALGSGVNNRVRGMTLLSDGDLMVGGEFTIAGGLTANRVARYRFGSICTADFNCSTHLEVQDIFDFLTAWFALDPRADFNGLNGITTQDIFDFLAAWFAGCG